MTTQSTAVSVFQYHNNSIRTIQDEQGEPWFVANDVCEVLDVQNVTQAIARLDEDERSMFNIGRQGEVNIINESGLYSLILGSRKPEARQFKKWITSEVLPSIRKHGAYMTPETIEKALLNPDFIIRLASELKVEQLKNRILTTELNAHKELRSIHEPKAKALDRISQADGSMCITNAAKIAHVRPKELFSIMKRERWIYKRPGNAAWIAYQDKIQTGDMEVKTTTISRSDGSERVIEQALVTAKGLTRLAQLINREVEQCGQ